MAEKTTLPQVNYVSDNPEQDWERFQGAMKHILSAPEKSLNDLPPSKSQHCKEHEANHNQYEHE